MFNNFKPVLVFAGLLGYASYAEAVLEAVIVSGARTEQSELTTPASITVITREEIRASGANHVIDVMQSQGGVLVVDSFGDGSRASISMRGFSGSSANANTLILIDGRRLNNTDISNPDLNSVSLRDVERIEIVQGGSGVLFGDQAVGGVINIITSGTREETGFIGVSDGSYNAYGVRAAKGGYINDEFHYRVSAEMRRSDNYRRKNNEIEYTNVTAKTGYDFSDGSFFVEVQRINEDLQLPGSLTVAELEADRRQTFVDFIGDFTNSETSVVRASGKYLISPEWTLVGDVTYRDVDRDIRQGFRGVPATSTSGLEREQVEFMPRIVGSIPVEYGNVQVTAGLDFISTDFDSEITFSEDKQKLISEYIQLVMPLSSKINLTTGYRHARVDDDVISGFVNGVQNASFDALELGLTYSISKEIKMFARVEQNFRFAKVDELTYVSPGTELKPQTGLSREAGLEFNGRDLSSKIIIYELSLKGEIAFDSSAPDPFGGTTGANVNFDPTIHRGVIVEAGYLFGQKASISGSYTYTDATFESGVFKGKDISGVASNTARLNANYKYTDSIGLNIGAVYVGSRFLDGDNDNLLSKADGYTVVNTNLYVSDKNWKLSFKINNLSGRKYFENANSFGSRFPLPERNIMLSAEWGF